MSGWFHHRDAVFIGIALCQRCHTRCLRRGFLLSGRFDWRRSLSTRIVLPEPVDGDPMQYRIVLCGWVDCRDGLSCGLVL